MSCTPVITIGSEVIQRKYYDSSISRTEHMKPNERMENLLANDIPYSTDNLFHHSRSLTIENFIGIWLHANIDTLNDDMYEDILNHIRHLRQIINFFKIFTNIKQCVDYLSKVKNEKVVMIISGSMWPISISRICDMTQVISIYIFCIDQFEHERWTSPYKKVRGIYTRIEALSNELAVDAQLLENVLTPISVIPPSWATDLNELDSSFMYSQLLKEILLDDKYDEQQKENFVNFCRPHYAENEPTMKTIDEFERKYPHPSAIWWYTYNCFLYRMLNKALRIQETEQIIKMGFFIRDLHQHIEQLSSQRKDSQPLTVYRGQGMAQSEFDKINNNKGGLLAFNNFLSTTVNREVSLNFARRTTRNDPDLKSIFFEIKVGLTQSVTPFASIDDISYFKNEREVLFSMHTIFRIGEIKQIEGNVFQINLTLTNENDQQLTKLTEYIREATQGQTKVRRLGSLMIAMAEFNKAEDVYYTLLNTTPAQNKEDRAFLHHQFGLINWEKRNLTDALSEFQESLKFYLTYLLPNDPQLASTYSNIGTVLQEQGDFDGALQHLKKALDISIAAVPLSELNIATQCNNIGLVLDKQGKYSEALKCYERALEIELAHLPPIHPLLATTYNNIGLVHQKTGNNSSALNFYEETLKIFKKSLPKNHPSLANTHHNIAYILDNLNRTQEAIEHITQAVNIGRYALGSDNPQVDQYQQYLEELQRKL